MTTPYTLFVVEDDDTLRFLLEAMFADTYTVETFDSAESCLARLADKVPDLFLLDISLPGMSGHDLCRSIRQLPAAQDVSVLFLSNHDDLDSILAGYDSGGDDYIVKPFDQLILQRRIEYFRSNALERKSFREQLQNSDELSSLVMANLDEYSLLIKFLRSLNECATPRALIASLFSLMQGYRLDSAIQIRLPGFELTASREGENRPFEVAVMKHVRNLDRIFAFKTRAAFNFGRITILVNNMPLDDSELCGRIRDNVLIAAECADTRLEALQIQGEHQQSKATAAELLANLQVLVGEIEGQNRKANYQTTEITQGLLDALARAFASLGLSDQQEEEIDAIVHASVGQLVNVYDFGDELHVGLNEMARQLASLLAPTSVADSGPVETAPRHSEPSVELF